MADIIQFQKLEDILKGTTLLKVEFEHFDEVDDPIDLSNTEVRCQFRHRSKTGSVVVDLSLGNGLTLNGVDNNIVEIDEIKNLNWNSGTYFYDIEITYTLTGKIFTYVEGTMNVIQDTTYD
jgi:hypothetical protein